MPRSENAPYVDSPWHTGEAANTTLSSCDEPSPFVGWVPVEEAAEGGDMLFQKYQAVAGISGGL